MPPMPAEAEAPPDLETPLTARPACSAARAMASSCLTVGRSRSIRSRSGKSCASSFSSARPANLSSGAARAIATARSASAALPSLVISLVETTAWRRPTSTRRPRSSPSALSDSSTAPSRTSIDSDIERTATASAASAPAARRGLHQPLGAVGEGALVEQGGGGGEHDVLSNGAGNGRCNGRSEQFADRIATPRQSCFATRRQSWSAKRAVVNAN